MRTIINLIAALAACTVFASSTLALTEAESHEVDGFLVSYLKNVQVHRRVTNQFAEVISCVDVERQPAMNHPSWRGTVQRELSPQGSAKFPGVIVPAPKSELCPDGTVEMRLPTRAQIAAAGGLRRFHAKYPDGSAGRFASPQSQSAPSAGHYYALVTGTKSVMAAQTYIEIWQPSAIGPQDFSLSQMWVIGGTGSGLQTVEAGWQAFPAHWQGDASSRFFIYFTANGYQGTGCYNMECPGFVQVSSVLPIGGVLPVSTLSSIQGGSIVWYRDPLTANWHLFLANPDGTFTMSGYYPPYLWNSGAMFSHGDRVDFGGEVYSPPTGAKPTVGMGNRINARYTWDSWYRMWGLGYDRNAAKQTNLKWMDLNGNTTDFVSIGTLMEPPWGGAGNGGCAYGGRYFASGEYDNYAANSGSVVAYGGQGYNGYWTGCE